MSEGPRVSAQLPLVVRRVGSGDHDRRKAAVLNAPSWNDQSPPPQSQNEGDLITVLEERVRELERKIDGLVTLIVGERRRQAYAEAVPLEIHRDGLRFNWPEAVQVGDILEIDLTLAILPASHLTCLVEVTGCSPESTGEAVADELVHYMVGARFSTISEEGRDAVDRYIFAQQRRQRRSSRSAA